MSVQPIELEVTSVWRTRYYEPYGQAMLPGTLVHGRSGQYKFSAVLSHSLEDVKIPGVFVMEEPMGDSRVVKLKIYDELKRSDREPALPVYSWIHGEGWSDPKVKDFVAAIASERLAKAMDEYERITRDEGLFPPLPSMIDRGAESLQKYKSLGELAGRSTVTDQDPQRAELVS